MSIKVVYRKGDALQISMKIAHVICKVARKFDIYCKSSRIPLQRKTCSLNNYKQPYTGDIVFHQSKFYAKLGDL